MSEIEIETELISYCGLFCGSCKSYRKGKCRGCRTGGKYKKCKMRPCCLEKEYWSCADCREFQSVSECPKYTNPLWDFLEFLFRTRRAAGIDYIKRKGRDEYADHMAKSNRVVLKR